MRFEDVYKICKPYTLTSLERMEKLYNAVGYIHNNKIEGDFVECGVFKGGSVMVMALAQSQFENTKKIHLYDTFSGMTNPEEIDKDLNGVSAKQLLKCKDFICNCSQREVENNMKKTGYPKDLFIFHKGDVLLTLKEDLPKKIAILRLDTDWYASTKIELEQLYPNLSENGILIIDDYGHFDGARKATDEYFKSIGVDPKFEKIDYTGVFHKKEVR